MRRRGAGRGAYFALIGCITLSIASAQQVALRVQLGHSEGVRTAQLSADDKYLVTGSQDGTARIWDVASGRDVAVLKDARQGMIFAVAFTRDRRHVITGGGDGIARLWDIRSGRVLEQFKGHAAAIRSLDVAAHGRLLVTGGADHTARVWDIASGRQLYTLDDHLGGEIASVAFSADEKMIATGSTDETARIWSLGNGRELLRIQPHAGAIRSVGISPDGRWLVTVSEYKGAEIWSIATGALKAWLDSDHSRDLPTAASAAFSTDGRWLLTGSNAGTAAGNPKTARLWDTHDWTVVQTFEAPALSVGPVAFSPDARYCLAAMWSDGVVLWDRATGIIVGRYNGLAARVQSVSFSPDGNYLATGSDDAARLWNLYDGVQNREFDASSMGVQSVAFSPHGASLATGGMDHLVRIWDIASGSEREQLGGSSAAVAFAYYLPDGKSMLTDSFDRTIRRWDLLRKEITHQITLPVSFGLAAPTFAISRDGQLLVAATGDSNAHIFATKALTPSTVFSGQKYEISAAAFSKDGTAVLTGGWDKYLRDWSVRTGKETRPPFDLGTAVFSVAISPDGQTVAAGGTGGIVKLWDMKRGSLLGQLKGHLDAVRSISFSSNGRYIATGSYDGTTRIWDAANQTEKAVLVGSKDGGWSVTGPNGRFDTSDLEKSGPLFWVVSDEPLRPLPIEIFMRDYYEPGLLARVLRGEKFDALPSIASLNRVQPRIAVKAEWADPVKGLARVSVRVQRNSAELPGGHGLRNVATDVYDLRVFRDGQLVAWAPSSSVKWQLEGASGGGYEQDKLRWREETRVPLRPNGTADLQFLVQVPRRAVLKTVAFSAYAFNEDRVKSETATASLPVTEALQVRPARAYIVSVGVDVTESYPNWQLGYAANDASKFSDVLQRSLKATGQYQAVVAIRLISRHGPSQPDEAAPTRVNLKAILDVLGGRRKVDRQMVTDIPGSGGLRAAQPEDLVLLEFSTHGFTDPSGVFHMVLADIGKNVPQDRITPMLERRTLSSDQLSAWLRYIDAGELTMIVDACHSEATIAYDGFKPGPMGSRGLGQLAYDKGMRILAASRSDQSAVELGGKISEGLLSYALVHEGLELGLADFKPKDGRILISEWLAYGAQEVPKLFSIGSAKGANGRGAVNVRDIVYLGSHQPPPSFQQPVLFDFGERHEDTLIAVH